MKQFIGFPSIDQFRNTVKSVRSSYDYHSEPYPTLTFTGTVKIHGCVSSTTMIAMADNTQLEIKNVQPGMEVLSYNETNKCIEKNSVLSVIIQELDKEWVELEFDDNTILQCTFDHPILTHNRGWIIASEITDNDNIVTL